MKRLYRLLNSAWRGWPIGLVLLLSGSLLWTERAWWLAWTEPVPHGLVLLVPDLRALEHPVTQAWLDAAQEEGLALQTMTSDRFVRAVARGETLAGVLVPDTVHTQASDVWVQALDRHIQQGGHALISHDAALHAVGRPRYAAHASRLSAMVGFRYGLYDELQDQTLALGPVMASREAEQMLAIVPGKIDFASPGSPWGELTTYGYSQLLYPYLRTAGPVTAKVWLQSELGDPIVSSHAHGQGSVLFANLPLGYLKTRTDGYWLHRLLGHFASQVLGQPLLSAAPEGIGGMVLNLHVDSNASESPMLDMEQSGWFRQGPFSIHITAGPDTYRVGDRMGLDIPRNLRMQGLLRRLHALGHDIGNHGGWIHNIYGEQANESNRTQFEPWLDLNHQTLARVLGQAPNSYSAPMGNQPVWSTTWLSRHGFKAYYTPGNNGMGPTRSYLGGLAPPPETPWAFPISSFLRLATFEELPRHGLPLAPMTSFITQLMHYTRDHGMVRLFYFHPAAAPEFGAALTQMHAHAQSLLASGRWRWYAMNALADFMQRRRSVQWTWEPGSAEHAPGLSAHSRQSLQGMAWVFPAGIARGLHLIEGQADLIEEADGRWRVVAGDVKRLRLHWQTLQPGNGPTGTVQDEHRIL